MELAGALSCIFIGIGVSEIFYKFFPNNEKPIEWGELNFKSNKESLIKTITSEEHFSVDLTDYNKYSILRNEIRNEIIQKLSEFLIPDIAILIIEYTKFDKKIRQINFRTVQS